MRIKKLKLENFRGFENIDIDFDDNLNVFIGKNGSGKTSVLDAIAFNLEHITKRLNTKNQDDPFNKNYWPRQNDLKKGALSGKLFFEIESKNKIYEQEFTIKLDGSHSYLNMRDIPESKKIDEFIKLTKKHLSDQLPVLLHIKANRNKVDQSDKGINYIDRLECYSGAFSFNNVHFSDFASWLERHENFENAERSRKQDLKFKTPSLECVRKALSKFFESLGQIDIKSLSINRQVDLNTQFKAKNVIKPPQLEVKKGNALFNIEQLSDGEQSLVIIVADIARRSFLASTNLGLNAFGIVLIDEIELHLHPGWQRKILPALTKTFPNIQFITTTHSPQVLSSVEKTDSVIYLKEFSQYSIRSPYGKDSNTILEEMDVDEGPFSDQIHQLYRYISEKKTKAAQKLQKELEAKIGADYGHLIKSRLFIERLVSQ